MSNGRVTAGGVVENDELERALTELREAVKFLDAVRASPADERVPVGSDHWEWLERAARRVVKAAPHTIEIANA